MPLHDIGSLPQWVQDRIKVAEMRAEEAQAELRAYLGDVPTNSVVKHGLEERPLPNNACIRFLFGKYRHIDIRIEEGHLNINGSSGLSIRPVANNGVTIALVEY